MSECLQCRCTVYLAEQNLTPNTIKLYLSAVRHLQVSMCLPDPRIGDMAHLEQVTKEQRESMERRIQVEESACQSHRTFFLAQRKCGIKTLGHSTISCYGQRVVCVILVPPIRRDHRPIWFSIRQECTPQHGRCSSGLQFITISGKSDYKSIKNRSI